MNYAIIVLPYVDLVFQFMILRVHMCFLGKVYALISSFLIPVVGVGGGGERVVCIRVWDNQLAVNTVSIYV